MRSFYFFQFISILLTCHFSVAQNLQKNFYKESGGTNIYVPLGKISFADEVIQFSLGTPKPFKKYRDSLQCLHEPNYTKYESPDFISLGCGGSITVAFTNNGFMNLKGDDLYIFEVGPSKETAKIEISTDSENWLYAGAITGGKSSIELSDEKIDNETVFHFLRITDLKSLCNSKTAGADIDAIAAINSVILLHINADVLFDSANFELKESAKNTLDSIVQAIRQVPNATLRINGHTDSDGEEAYNLALSQKRCLSVEARLKTLLGEKALYDYEINAFGETRPRVANDTDENKHLNRRVEILVLPPKAYYDTLEK